MSVSKFIKNIIQRFDYKVSSITAIEFLSVALIYLMMKFADPSWFVENGIVENLQIVILVVAFIICITAKQDKSLFVFCGLVVLLLIMRETNFGRSYFCAKYLSADEICRWKNMRYGYIAEYGRLLYCISIVIYAYYHKLWKVIWKYVTVVPIYIWDIAIILLCTTLGVMAEFKSVDNEILEECAEGIVYFALAYCLWRYSRSPLPHSEK